MKPVAIGSTPAIVRLDYVHLDMLRGLAALGVFASHLRAFVLPPYQQLKDPNLLESALWFVTGFGHQCVMIFFVLSGFFIARSIMQDQQGGRFSWPTYLIKRLARLWVVLLPCLVLTWALDVLGTRLSGSDFYDGRLYAMYNSGPGRTGEGIDLSLTAFLGNLLFLQTIAAPVYGSNGPLWSLAYEFWYYMMFPLFYIASAARTALVSRLLMIALGLAIGLAVGRNILLYGLIWLLGALAYTQSGTLQSQAVMRLTVCAAAAALAIALAFSRVRADAGFSADLLIGLATAGLVFGLAGIRTRVGAYTRAARLLADTSYTIYLCHFPLVAFLASVALGNGRLTNDAGGYLTAGLFAAATLAYCYVVYFLFERRTNEIRGFFLRMYRQAPGKA